MLVLLRSHSAELTCYSPLCAGYSNSSVVRALVGDKVVFRSLSTLITYVPCSSHITFAEASRQPPRPAAFLPLYHIVSNNL